MDIEQLKLVLDTIGSASDGAFTIALIWLGQGYFVTLVAGCVIIFIGKMVSVAVHRFSFYHTLQEMIGGPRGELYRSERRRILELIELGKKYEKQLKKEDK